MRAAEGFHRMLHCDATTPALRCRWLALVTLCALIVSGVVRAQSQFGLSPAESQAHARPLPRSTPRIGGQLLPAGVEADSIWSIPLPSAAPRGTSGCEFDNGAPLDDFGDPSSHLSEPPADPAWQFLAGAADDFIFVEPMPAEPNCRITVIRAAFFIDDPKGLASPTNTWDTVLVTVYPNNVSDLPAGEPDNMGGVIGPYIKSQEVPASALQNETLVNVCRPCHVVDIPVNILVRKNTRYWLSIVPRYAAPPQSFWCVSESNTDFGAVFGFPLDPMFPFWVPISGNLAACPDTPGAGMNTNLSFVMTAFSEPDVTGACCNDDLPGCTDTVSEVDCQQLNQRFAPGATCASMPFNPICGTNAPGACCLADAGCIDMRTPAECDSIGGTYVPGDCMSVSCMGACCHVDGTCDDLPEDGCVMPGDTFGGPNTLCGVFTCPPPGGMCAVDLPQEVTGSDSITGDFFGESVAISGDLAVVGANTHGGIGAAYVFLQTAGTWAEDAKLTPADGAAADAFGDAVALDGNTAIVGAPSGPGAMPDAGAAYVFVDSGGGWMPQQKLFDPAGVNTQEFGYSAALSGNTALIGARNDPTSGASAGAGFVFVRSAGVWTLQQQLLAMDAATGDQLGSSADVDADTAILGAIGDDDGGNGAGAAYVFTRTAGVWTEQMKLVASDPAANNAFGWSVAVDGDTAIVGAPFVAGGGAAYVFVRSAGVWTQQEKLTADDRAAGDQFGMTVALDSDTVVIGAPGDDDGGSAAGSAYVFVRTGGIWTQRQKVVADDPAASSNFGGSVGFSAGTIVAGATGGEVTMSDSGSAYFFDLSCEGACCLSDGMCLLLTPEDCAMMDGTPLGNGTICQPDSCLFLTRGCAGDLDNDCAVTDADLPIFVDALLGNILLTAAAACRADVNADDVLNGLDIQPFIDRLLMMAMCNCCRGDINRDGLLDGLDLQGLVNFILMPPDPCSLDFANADVNADDVIDLLDAEAMVAKLMAGETCPVMP